MITLTIASVTVISISEKPRSDCRIGSPLDECTVLMERVMKRNLIAIRLDAYHVISLGELHLRHRPVVRDRRLQIPGIGTHSQLRGLVVLHVQKGLSVVAA